MAISVTTNNQLVAEDVRSLLIEPLLQTSSFLSNDFPTFESDGSEIRIPALSSLGTAAFTAEGTAIAELSANTSEITLLASSIRPAMGYLRISNDLINQGVVNVQESFALAMVRETARLVDSALWAGGTADAGSPIGITGYTGTTNAGTVAGTAITADTLYGVEAAAELAFTDANALFWAMSPTVKQMLRGVNDSQGSKLWQPSLAQGVPNTLLGKPVVVTSHLPDTGLWLIDRGQIAVGIDRNASVSFHPDRFAEYNEQMVRVSFRADAAPMNAQAVTVLTIT